MNHSPFAFLSAGLTLVGCPLLIEKVLDSDFERELRVSNALSSLPADGLAVKRLENRKHTLKRLHYLRRKTLISFAWTASAVFFAMVLFSIPQLSPPKLSQQHLFAIVSVGSFSWGTLGRLGWHHGSFSGATIYEELDTIIFWFLYWIGTMCGIAALFGNV